MRRLGVLGLLMAVACGGKHSGTGGAGGASSNGGAGKGATPDAWRAPAQTETPPLPPFPDLCSRFEIVRSSRAPIGADPHLTCPCAGGLYGLCDASSCVTSFSCEALCASFGEPGPSFHDCAGNCEVGRDYGPIECLQLPGAAQGTFRTGAWCFDDRECGAEGHCVVITSEGYRTCSNGECNDQSECSSGQRCALPDDSFLGFCGDGRDGSICFSDADCRASTRCILGANLLAPSERGTCSSGERGAPCVEDSDCSVGHCRLSKCSSGEAYDGCVSDSDCQAGLHCQNWGITYDPDYSLCSDGSVSSSCQDDGDCAAGLYCAEGVCQDGTDERYCSADEQCLSGRCQLAGDGPTCTSGAPDSRCMDAGDCMSGSCTRALGVFDWQSGRCD